MKKESVNRFNGGMVKDLNPLVTPDNVLTDVLNGSFITFNGDEMMLQNDMGNIPIQYNAGTEDNPNWQDVNLGEGFFPLGVKEYGGVLYIVSAKGVQTITAQGITIPIPEEYSSLKSYVTGDYVKITEITKSTDINTGLITNLDVVWYYKAKTNISSGDNAPLLTTDIQVNWKLFAKDIPTEFTLIETQVGSYPAPEQANSLGKTASVQFNTWDLLDQTIDNTTTFGSLELQQQFGNLTISGGDNLEFVINLPGEYTENPIISSGQYVSGHSMASIDFGSIKKFYLVNYGFIANYNSLTELEDLILIHGTYLGEVEKIEGVYPNYPTLYDYLSSYSTDTDNTIVRKLFKLKIYQVLSNGSIDITNNFKRTYQLGNLYYWFNTGSDGSATDGSSYSSYIQNRFKGKLVAKLELEDIDLFEVTDPTITANYSGASPVWDVTIGVNTTTSSLISITKCSLYIDDILYIDKNNVSEFELINGQKVIQFQRSKNDSGKTFTYKIIPIFNYENIPQKYIEKYTLTGSLVTTSTTTKLQFITKATTRVPNITHPELSIKEATIVELRNSGGDLIDITYSQATKPNIFVQLGISSQTLETLYPNGYVLLSYFKYIGSLASLVTSENVDNNSFQNLGLQLEFESSTALRVVDPDSGNYPFHLYNFTKILFNNLDINPNSSTKTDVILHNGISFGYDYDPRICNVNEALTYSFTEETNYSQDIVPGLYAVERTLNGIQQAEDLFDYNLFNLSGQSDKFILSSNLFDLVKVKVGNVLKKVYLYMKQPLETNSELLLNFKYGGIDYITSLQTFSLKNIGELTTELPTGHLIGTINEIPINYTSGAVVKIWDENSPNSAPLFLDLKMIDNTDLGFMSDVELLRLKPVALDRYLWYDKYKLFASNFISEAEAYQIDEPTLLAGVEFYIKNTGSNIGLVFSTIVNI